MRNSIVAAINELGKCIEYFEDFKRDVKGGIGEKIANNYINKLNWILTDFKTIPLFTDELREKINKEVKADKFQVDALYEKILDLESNNREIIENQIDTLLSNQKIKWNG